MEAQQDWAWLVLGWKTTGKYQGSQGTVTDESWIGALSQLTLVGKMLLFLNVKGPYMQGASFLFSSVSAFFLYHC